ncbi:MAG TPA: DUF418 domain-containing protein [Pseudonocardia sp.]
MSVAEPAPGGGRIATLDVLRGIAILGTFASNAWLFAVPGGAFAWVSGGLVPQDPVEAGLRLLSNGKFLALLTLLFGIGIELQYRSALRRGLPWPGRYPLRALILFVEGALNYVLVFEFDVLMGYAVAAVLVAYLIGRSDRLIRAWIVVVGTLFAVVLLGLTAVLLAVPDTPGPPPVVDASATASWTAQVAARLQFFPLFRIEIPLIVPSATVLFLAGALLLRAGALTDTAAGMRIRRRLMVVGFGVALPLNALTAFGSADWFLVDRYLLPPVVALGLFASVTTVGLRSRRAPGAARRGLTAVGRTALSCYVAQNVLGAFLCYGWGLGLAVRFADAPSWWVVGLWATVCALLMVAASLWLRRFDRGPLELLAHRVQGMGRVPARAGSG